MTILKSNLFQRIITALVLGPVVLALLFVVPNNVPAQVVAALITLAVFGLGMWEWVKITKSSKKKYWWWAFGAIYIMGPGLYCVDLIRKSTGDIPMVMVLVFTMLFVWASDIGGYVAGNFIGGRKLAPKISPKKTWAGFFGGFIFVYITALIFERFLFTINEYYVPMSICLAAQLGDLFESWIKRKFKVKDSGNVLPGHGGILDRIDGLIAGLWLMYFLLEIVKI